MMEELAGEYLACARELSLNNCLNKSLEMYLMAFEKSPEMKSSHAEEFRTVLLQENEDLAAENKTEEIFNNFGRALNIFPENQYILNDIGKYLYKYGFYSEAWYHFEEALRLDSSFVNPEKNLNSVKNLLVERWHFRMLNDRIRNDAYHEAIFQAAHPRNKDHVLDIGTGTGLLAMFAAKYKPESIFACDGSEIMADLADCITQENGMMDVMIISKMSTCMKPSDMKGRCTLIVTELFDAGLLGEHILQTLVHAWENLIYSEGRVIPNRAEFFVAPAKCDVLHSKYQLSTSVKTLLNIPTLNVHILTNNETYDCEDVHLFKDIKYMGEPQSILQVDFNNDYDIQEKLSAAEPFSVQFKATEAGEINTYIGWFKLYLTDSITITTDPRSERRANAWQQAVFFDNPPVMVQENQTVSMEFLINGGKLTMLQEINTEVLRVSQDTIRFLNDSEFMKMITGCIGMACVYLGQMTEMSQMAIVDLCPFPLFGLQMLKRGVKSLACFAKTDGDKVFFQKVFEANNIPLTNITILVGDNWSLDELRDEKYHAIFMNILEMCGEIDFRLREMAQYLRNVNLVQGGLFIPANVKMVAQLVNSHWLDINNRVYDENVSNFKVAQFLNRYQVSQNFCIDLSHLEYTPVSDPIPLGICSNEMTAGVFNVPIIKDGYASAILCWYTLEFMENLNEISTNRCYSFMDGIVFLANPAVEVVAGTSVKLLRSVDLDGTFKLSIEV